MRKDFCEIGTEKKFLITGSAGFIGFHLAKELLELGCTVVGYDNLNDYYDVSLKEARLEILKGYDGFRLIQGDLADASMLSEVFLEYEPQIVVNLAAQASVRYSIQNPAAYMKSNMIGFFNILEECRKSYAQDRISVEHLVLCFEQSTGT